MGNREVPYEKYAECNSCGKLGAHDFMGDYLCDACLGYTESDNVIPKVGLEAFNELAESHESHIRQIKKLEEEVEYYKQLDCEGVDVNKDAKGKVDINEKLLEDVIADRMLLKIIEWIQNSQSEMDLQTKTPEEILEEYNENN